MRIFVKHDEDVHRVTGYNPETEEFDSTVEAPITFIAETDEEHDEILEFVKKHVPNVESTDGEDCIDEMVDAAGSYSTAELCNQVPIKSGGQQ